MASRRQRALPLAPRALAAVQRAYPVRRYPGQGWGCREILPGHLLLSQAGASIWCKAPRLNPVTTSRHGSGEPFSNCMTQRRIRPESGRHWRLRRASARVASRAPAIHCRDHPPRLVSLLSNNSSSTSIEARVVEVRWAAAPGTWGVAHGSAHGAVWALADPTL